MTRQIRMARHPGAGKWPLGEASGDDDGGGNSARRSRSLIWGHPAIDLCEESPRISTNNGVVVRHRRYTITVSSPTVIRLYGLLVCVLVEDSHHCVDVLKREDGAETDRADTLPTVSSNTFSEPWEYRTGQTLARVNPSFQKSCATPRYFQHTRKLLQPQDHFHAVVPQASLNTDKRRAHPIPHRYAATRPHADYGNSQKGSPRSRRSQPLRRFARTSHPDCNGSALHIDSPVCERISEPKFRSDVRSSMENLSRRDRGLRRLRQTCVYKSRNTVTPPTAEATQNREERGRPGSLEHRPDATTVTQLAAHHSSWDHEELL
ncbi:hypothetical protein EDB86DRAFT_3131825 [Lactarius hatsudake]|nr:hypothetical protein EDB86DRAFT_3131825 [Lactarius hatsudake]